jgi:hypothetical protein
MRMPGSRLKPTSPSEIYPHLKETCEIRPDVSWQGGWVVSSRDWPVPPNVVYGDRKTKWFRLDQTMLGPKTGEDRVRLRSNVGGAILLGQLGEELFGRLSLKCDSSAEKETFYFAAEEAPENTLELAAKGIFHYLNGVDMLASERIARRADDVIEAQRARTHAAVDAFLAQGGIVLGKDD